MTTPDETNNSPAAFLRAIGTALYGQEWIRPLAAALELHETQIRRWMQRPGRLDREHILFRRALALLRSRREETAALIAALNRWLPRL